MFTSSQTRIDFRSGCWVVFRRRLRKEAAMEGHSYAPVPLRLAMGIILSVAGYMKLIGIAGTIAYFTKLGFPLPVVTAWFITLLELVGGIALILGLFVRFRAYVHDRVYRRSVLGQTSYPRLRCVTARFDDPRRRCRALLSRRGPLVHRFHMVGKR